MYSKLYGLIFCFFCRNLYQTQFAVHFVAAEVLPANPTALQSIKRQSKRAKVLPKVAPHTFQVTKSRKMLIPNRNPVVSHSVLKNSASTQKPYPKKNLPPLL